MTPKVAVVPLLEISLQLSDAWPRSWQAVSVRVPMIALVLVVAGVNWQLRAFSTHAHSPSFGVPGRVLEATKSEVGAAQLGNAAAAADDWVGVLAKLTFPYSVLRVSKSEPVVMVLPSEEMLTRPNCPSLLTEGK